MFCSRRQSIIYLLCADEFRLPLLFFGRYVREFGVDHDAAAVFADDDFFVHLDFHLFLGRDSIEATTAGITLYVNDTETVSRIFANAFEGFESTVVFGECGFDFESFLAQAFFLFACFAHDLVEF